MIIRSSRTYYLNRTTFNMERIVKQITTTTQKPFKLVKFMENTQIPISNFLKNIHAIIITTVYNMIEEESLSVDLPFYIRVYFSSTSCLSVFRIVLYYSRFVKMCYFPLRIGKTGFVGMSPFTSFVVILQL